MTTRSAGCRADAADCAGIGNRGSISNPSGCSFTVASFPSSDTLPPVIGPLQAGASGYTAGGTAWVSAEITDDVGVAW